MKLAKEFLAPFIGYYKNSVVLQRFTKVFSLDVLVKASNMLLLLVYLKLIAVDDVGLFTYILSIIGLFATILNFGFKNVSNDSGIMISKYTLYKAFCSHYYKD